MFETRLFGNWLEETKALQELAYGHVLPKTEIPDIVQWVVINHVSAIDELHEALNEVSWKPWASAQFVNREAFIGEIVDALHFVGNLLAGVGCTDEELSAAYAEKMTRNAKRQLEGYDGVSDKCSICRRDMGDLKAHGDKGYEEKATGIKFCELCLGVRLNHNKKKRDAEYNEI